MAGFAPNREDIELTRGSDFVHIYRKDAKDPEFPDGTTAEIIITKDSKVSSPVIASWPAEDVSGEEIAFWVQNTNTDTIPDRVAYRLMVHYPPVVEGAEIQDTCWFRGNVRRERTKA